MGLGTTPIRRKERVGTAFRCAWSLEYGTTEVETDSSANSAYEYIMYCSANNVQDESSVKIPFTSHPQVVVSLGINSILQNISHRIPKSPDAAMCNLCVSSR